MSKKKQTSNTNTANGSKKAPETSNPVHPHDSGLDMVTIIFGVFLTSSIIFIFINNPMDKILDVNGMIILAVLIIMDFFPISSIIRHYTKK